MKNKDNIINIDLVGIHGSAGELLSFLWVDCVLVCFIVSCLLFCFNLV